VSSALLVIVTLGTVAVAELEGHASARPAAAWLVGAVVRFVAVAGSSRIAGLVVELVVWRRFASVVEARPAVAELAAAVVVGSDFVALTVVPWAWEELEEFAVVAEAEN